MPTKLPPKNQNQSTLEQRASDSQQQECGHVAHGKFPCGGSQVLQKRVLSNVLKPKIISDPMTMNYSSKPQAMVSTDYLLHNEDNYTTNNTLNNTIEFKNTYATQNNYTDMFNTSTLLVPHFDRKKLAGMNESTRNGMSELCRQSLTRLRRSQLKQKELLEGRNNKEVFKSLVSTKNSNRQKPMNAESLTHQSICQAHTRYIEKINKRAPLAKSTQRSATQSTTLEDNENSQCRQYVNSYMLHQQK